MKRNKLTKVISLVMALAIIISMAVPFASAAKKVPQYGISNKPVTGNADKVSFPKELKKIEVGPNSLFTYVYFNFQADSNTKVKWVEVWTKYQGQKGGAKLLHHYEAQNYLRYTAFRYQVSFFRTNSTLEYYFKVQETNGKQHTSDTKTIDVVWNWKK